MKDTLADIREKLRNGLYQNEEHVRLSLVARVLRELGWDIWNPREVNAEFVAAPEEDKTRVDLALFTKPQAPSVFIEVKAVGKIADLARIERQLRDYNKNILVPFCVITDGNKWRFYSSRAPGKFAEKCFKQFSLLSDDLDDIEQALATFLHKSSILSDDSEKEAKTLLMLTQKEKAMEECLSKARRIVQEPPFLSLPEALTGLVAERGFNITTDEARKFIGQVRPPEPPQEPDNREPVVEPETEAAGLGEWCKKHGVSAEGRAIFERIVEHLRSINKEVSYKVGRTAMSISCFGRAMAFVFPRKSGIHLHFFVRNSPIGEARVTLRKGKPGKWASMTLRNQRELEQALPWLEESLRRLHQAVSRNETTDWRLPRDEA